jgi:hypothetical protein
VVQGNHRCDRSEVSSLDTHAQQPSRAPVVNEAVIGDIIDCLSGYLDVRASEMDIRAIVEEAYKVTDGIYGMQAANEWAAGFSIPQAAIDSDLRLFQASNRDFDRMVSRRLKSLRSSRFNRERVAECIGRDNPDFERLLALADGMEVPLPTDFQANGQREHPPLRKKYIQVHTAVNKLLHEQHHAKGLAVYLPPDIVQREVIGANLSCAHWAPQKDKVQGRHLIDASDESVPGSTLNGPETRDKAAELWGEIHHPTIQSIVDMVLTFWADVQQKYPHATWEDLVMYKMDLKGAYTLLSFRPENVKLFGMELVNDDTATTAQLVIFFISGIFGWTGTPAAFQVVTRALLYELRRSTKGALTMYVDDAIGICLRWDLQEELGRAKTLFTGLLGPEAVAEHKTVSGRRIDNLGYITDLDKQRLTISRKNFMKAFYGYFTVDLTVPVAVTEVERLASWGTRYALICRHMRVFNRALYALIARRDETQRLRKHVTVPWTAAARMTVRLWRATLCAVHLDESRFARTFESFRTGAEAQYVGEFDSSLEGTGALIYQRAVHPVRFERRVGGSAVDLTSLAFDDDSSHQNTAEFIGVIMVIVTMIRLGIRVDKISIRGDSITALTWATEERFRSDLVINAATVFVLLCISLEVEIIDQTHISKDINTVCDALSRPSMGKTKSDLGLDDIPIIDLNNDAIVKELLVLCNPRTPRDSDEEFRELWRRIKAVAAELRAINITL